MVVLGVVKCMDCEIFVAFLLGTKVKYKISSLVLPASQTASVPWPFQLTLPV
jgi:hypothetical protein